MASSPETAVKVKVTSVAGAGRQPIEIEGEAPRVAVGPARLRQRQRPVRRRAFDKEIERRTLGAATSTTTRSCSPPGSRRRNHRETFAGAGRDAARHAQLFLFQRRLFGAVAGQRQFERRFGRHAQIAADGVVELQMQRRMFCRVLLHDAQRQHDPADIADGIAAGAVGNRSGAGHSTVTDLTLSEPEKSNVGGTPESPGSRQ